MELHHLRRFSVLAEELHFTRAAERLHIEQSPLSRTIKELEGELGVLLFSRGRRGTQLTKAGNIFLQDVRRVFTVLEQARENVKAVCDGYLDNLHIALSDGAIDPRLSTFLARCREEEPEIDIHLSEVPLHEQLRGLRSGDFMFGLAHTADIGEDIAAEPIWETPLVAAIPARHPLLAHKAIPLRVLLRYPLVLCEPQICEGYGHEWSRLLHSLEHAPNIVERTASQEMMLTLVGAGYGVGFTTVPRFALYQRPDVVIRPLAEAPIMLVTYLLRLDGGYALASLDRFAARLYDCADASSQLTATTIGCSV